MKPGYTVSRKYIWWSFWLAWASIILLIIGGLMGSEKVVDLADITIPSMVAIIVCNLGVHRGFGSIDFWASAKNRRRKNSGDWNE